MNGTVDSMKQQFQKKNQANWEKSSLSSSEKQPYRSIMKRAYYDLYLCFLLGGVLKWL